MVISFIYRDRIHESMQEREFMTRAVLIRMPDSMYDDIEALRKELNIPSTSSMIRVLIREALFNHSARKRLDEAAAAHDKEAIDAIAKEVALIYGAGSWAHEGEAKSLRAMAEAGQKDVEVDIRTTHGIDDACKTRLSEKYGAFSE